LRGRASTLFPGAHRSMLDLVLSLALFAASMSPPSHAAKTAAETRPPRFEFSAGSVSVPMHLETGRLIVHVRINGRGPFPFILDTGAHGSVFDLDFARELKLSLGDSARVASPGGRGLVARMVTVDRLEIGGLTVHDASGAAITGLPFPPGGS